MIKDFIIIRATHGVQALNKINVQIAEEIFHFKMLRRSAAASFVFVGTF